MMNKSPLRCRVRSKAPRPSQRLGWVEQTSVVALAEEQLKTDHN